MDKQYFVVFETGDRIGVTAAGPEDAVQQVYSMDKDGTQPFVIGVYLVGNSYVGRIAPVVSAVWALDAMDGTEHSDSAMDAATNRVLDAARNVAAGLPR